MYEEGQEYSERGNTMTPDSDDDESELEELVTVESVRETEMSDNIL
jgi:hypothetical protein